MNRTRILFAALALAALSSPSRAEDDPLSFRIERMQILTGPDEYYLFQSRGALIPGAPPRVLVTTQETDRAGSHGYRDLFQTFSDDGGKTWSPLARIDSLRRVTTGAGYDFVIGDVCPQWHAKTQVVLATGKTFGFREGTKEDKLLERVSYSVYSPKSGTWSGLQLVELPRSDHEGRPIAAANAGCNQRFDLPDGEILLPIRYQKDPARNRYTTIVARCRFDGATLTYLEHGSELTRDKGRGLYEPSVAGFGGRFFLTMRADDTGFVARSEDGLNYGAPLEWKFDDGAALGSYNTQQHWVAHSDALFLVYTRRGVDNDHVYRHRAPLLIAQVDPQRLCVLRETEQVLIPENDATLGNFGVIEFSPGETWVITSEGLAQGKRSAERNHVLIAKLHWSRPNRSFPASDK